MCDDIFTMWECDIYVFALVGLRQLTCLVTHGVVRYWDREAIAVLGSF